MDCLYLRKKALLLDVFVVFILHVNTNTQGEFKVRMLYRIRTLKV